MQTIDRHSFIQTVKEKGFYNSKGIHCIKSAVEKMSITFTITTKVHNFSICFVTK